MWLSNDGETEKIREAYISKHNSKNKKISEADSIYNVRYKTQKEIPVVFHNGSNSEYYFKTTTSKN